MNIQITYRQNLFVATLHRISDFDASSRKKRDNKTNESMKVVLHVFCALVLFQNL